MFFKRYISISRFDYVAFANIASSRFLLTRRYITSSECCHVVFDDLLVDKQAFSANHSLYSYWSRRYLVGIISVLLWFVVNMFPIICL